MAIAETPKEIVIEGKTLKLVHTNHIRTIYEWNGEDSSITYYEILSSEPLGNHYHTKKTERFKLVAGGGLLITQTVNTDGSSNDDLDTWTLVPGDEVTVPELTAHKFVLTPGSIMTCHSNRAWKKDDQDFNPFPL